MIDTDLPIAVIGGGPVGLAAAVHLKTRGQPVKLYEAGRGIAANVRDWGHVRLFRALAPLHRSSCGEVARTSRLAAAAL